MFFPKKEFNKISCKEANVNKDTLIQMFKTIIKDQINIHQMLLLKNGSLVYEAYAKNHKDKLENVYSVSKSFTSIAVGILIDRKILTLDDYVLFYFVNDLKKYKKAYEKLQLKHLLTMTVGQEKDRFHGLTPQHDPIEVFFNTDLKDQPGQVFMYSNFATLILSAIVTKVTGKTLNEFLRIEVYDKIGIGEVYWPEFSGYTLGCTGLRISARDLSRFGLLLLNEGLWDDEQIVSKSYIQEATKKQVDTKDELFKVNRFGYGYQFWLNEFGDFKAAGLYNQLIIVNKKHQLVFSLISYEEKRPVVELFSKYILKAFDEAWKVTHLSLRDFIKDFEMNSIKLIQKEEKERKH